jgi:hypothetical protein
MENTVSSSEMRIGDYEGQLDANPYCSCENEV